jgi:predicted outer membrane repeat protein
MPRPTAARTFRPHLEHLEPRALLSVFIVDRLTDAGQGQDLAGDLRYCLTQAADGDSITFGVTGTVNLTGALPDLTHSISIQGPGADLMTVRRDTGGVYRIFTVAPGTTVSLSGLTIANGNPGLGEVGGGIFNSGALMLSSCTVSGNVAGNGGGIYGGTLSVSDSTFSDNHVPFLGGGLFGITLSVSDSTFSGNSASLGGGIYGLSDSTSISQSTVSNNVASSPQGAAGIQIQSNGTFIARDTIVAGNTGGDVLGSVTGDDNLIGGDPQLGPLQDNGGPTQTMALRPGSPALNAGDPDLLGSTGQRGVVRTGGVNIGAYQASAASFRLDAPAALTAGVPFDVTVMARDPFGQVAVGYTGTVTFGTTDPDPGVVLSADYTFTPGDGGIHTFTDTGLGETTLLTPGEQSLTVTDTADGTITGGATVTVGGPAPGAGQPPVSHSGPATAPINAPSGRAQPGQEELNADRYFAALRPGEVGPLWSPKLARGEEPGPWG